MLDQSFTASFVEKIATPDGQARANQIGSKFILDRLRERSFARPILNAQPITRDQCQISTRHDTLVKIEWIEPQARAMNLTFRDMPDAEFITTRRCEMAFSTIASAIFQKNEQELLVYGDMPVTKVIEDNSLKDMEELEDRGFIVYAEAAVQAMQADANGVATAPALSADTLRSGSPPIEFSVVKSALARQATVMTAAPFYMQRPDIQTLRSLLTDNRLRGDLLLFTESDWNGVSTWTLEDMGDKMQSETLVDGYKYNTLLGLKYVKSIKNDILRRGNVYLFTEAQYLGKFYILNASKFYVDKRFNMISWMAWEDIGMLFANIGAVKKMELYPGDATVNDANGVRSQFVPKDVRNLGAVNNRVEDGLTFPRVASGFLSCSAALTGIG